MYTQTKRKGEDREKRFEHVFGKWIKWKIVNNNKREEVITEGRKIDVTEHNRHSGLGGSTDVERYGTDVRLNTQGNCVKYVYGRVKCPGPSLHPPHS